MFALVESMGDLAPLARGEAKNYLEGFFRAIDKPAAIKKQFVDGCKQTPAM
jgi:hypothetical protein